MPARRSYRVAHAGVRKRVYEHGAWWRSKGGRPHYFGRTRKPHVRRQYRGAYRRAGIRNLFRRLFG